MMYEITSRPTAEPSCTPAVEGKRSSMKAAFVLARKLWREYKGTALIEVRLGGGVIADDPSDFSLSRK